MLAVGRMAHFLLQYAGKNDTSHSLNFIYLLVLLSRVSICICTQVCQVDPDSCCWIQ